MISALKAMSKSELIEFPGIFKDMIDEVKSRMPSDDAKRKPPAADPPPTSDPQRAPNGQNSPSFGTTVVDQTHDCSCGRETTEDKTQEFCPKKSSSAPRTKPPQPDGTTDNPIPQPSEIEAPAVR
jgi:hypothetical protein